LAAYYAETLHSIVPAISAAEITAVFANQLLIWASAAMLLASACYAKLIFSLRRHRVDDFRGRYRVWRTASWAALALSLNAVIGGHSIVARALGYFTSWSVLPGNAGWWLAAAVIVGGYLLLKLIFDVAECRGAAFAYGLAAACFVVAGANAAGWSPTWAAAWPDTMSRAFPLAANLLLLVGTLLFARYVVLDVQGLISHRSITVQNARETISPPQQESPEPEEIQQEIPVQAAFEENAWVDGSEMGTDDQSHANRRLSKSERKRLRKQKNRNRAA